MAVVAEGLPVVVVGVAFDLVLVLDTAEPLYGQPPPPLLPDLLGGVLRGRFEAEELGRTAHHEPLAGRVPAGDYRGRGLRRGHGSLRLLRVV